MKKFEIQPQYMKFATKIIKEIPSELVFTDNITRLVYGTDASCYRIVPQVVIKAQNEAHVFSVLKFANEFNLEVTFRGAGTSLSGQALSKGILVMVQDGWKKHEILDNGKAIKLDVGIIVNTANDYLAPYGKKLGPDPATSAVALIGGVVNNNSSGMCCGVHQNTYHTIKDVRIVLFDGTILDTSDSKSVASFKITHKNLLENLENLAKEVHKDKDLAEVITKKYKIKNTTGYGLNSLVDFSDGIDILKHLIVGSEGTLAFVSNVTYYSVDDYKHKASALVFFNSIEDACNAIISLDKLGNVVESAEFMDRTSLKTIENDDWVPSFIKSLHEDACAILIQTANNHENILDSQIAEISQILNNFKLCADLYFTKDPKEYGKYWKIRKGLFPKVGALRRKNTSVIIEDITFPIVDLAKGTLELREMLNTYNFADSIIFGHSLAGNLHFVICVDFANKEEVKNYDEFMTKMTDMVALKYQGSLKAEHGTGRNIAPFVIKEWGAKAYSLMERIKITFDPKNLLNPDVIITKDPQLHLKDLKEINECNDLIDKCIECGLCEPTCPSKNLTFTPRQRIVAYRYLHNHNDPVLLAELEKDAKIYNYKAIDTCAGCSLCSIVCPVGINTGTLTKQLRFENRGFLSTFISKIVAKLYPLVLMNLRLGLIFIGLVKKLINENFIKKTSIIINKFTFRFFPVYRTTLPAVANLSKLNDVLNRSYDNTENNNADQDSKTFVYFVSCMNKVFGDNNHPLIQNKSIYEVFESLAKKSGYKMIVVADNSLCCGMPFYSKGFVEAGNMKSQSLEERLSQASGNGKYPIVADLSSCTLQMLTNFKSKQLKIYDIGSFALNYLVKELSITPLQEKITIHVNCSAQKIDEKDTQIKLAKLCAKEVVIPKSISCCGFAGDKGFFNPELNTSALKELKNEVEGCSYGFSTNCSCEIGLSEVAKIPYTSIIYLLDSTSNPRV
jgi:D-lactate dehydrogenase